MLNTQNIYICADFNQPESLSFLATTEFWLGVTSFNSTQINSDIVNTHLKNDIKRKCQSSSLFIFLLNENIKVTNDIIQFEIEAAIVENLPVIVINLNNMWQQDIRTCPELLRYELAVHIPFNEKILKHAISNWPSEHKRLKEQDETGAYYYKREVYERLGIFE